jgi:RNA polymerase sigma-B factor
MSHRTREKSASERERMDRTERLFDELVDEVDESRRRDLLNDLVVLNMPVARSVARKFSGRGCAVEDLEQTACIALIRAARDFEPGRGHHFLAYAVPCISGSVKKYFRDSGWTVRPPRPVQELQNRLEAVARVIDPATGSEPTQARLAELLGVEERAIDEALKARGCFTPTSLDLGVGDDDPIALGDLLVAPEDGAIEAVEARVVLAPALARLSAADRSVLSMRFVEERTQQQMAEELGTTQPAVSRLLSRILDEMHTLVTHQPSTPAPAG